MNSDYYTDFNGLHMCSIILSHLRRELDGGIALIGVAERKLINLLASFDERKGENTNSLKRLCSEDLTELSESYFDLNNDTACAVTDMVSSLCQTYSTITLMDCLKELGSQYSNNLNIRGHDSFHPGCSMEFTETPIISVSTMDTTARRVAHVLGGLRLIQRRNAMNPLIDKIQSLHTELLVSHGVGQELLSQHLAHNGLLAKVAYLEKRICDAQVDLDLRRQMHAELSAMTVDIGKFREVTKKKETLINGFQSETHAWTARILEKSLQAKNFRLAALQRIIQTRDLLETFVSNSTTKHMIALLASNRPASMLSESSFTHTGLNRMLGTEYLNRKELLASCDRSLSLHGLCSHPDSILRQLLFFVTRCQAAPKQAEQLRDMLLILEEELSTTSALQKRDCRLQSKVASSVKSTCTRVLQLLESVQRQVVSNERLLANWY